ncbi:MAG: metallophosphoesterase [Bacteroidota bacterium]
MRIYSIKNILILFILFQLLIGCKKNNSIKYSFFVAGHAYGSTDDKAPGLHPPFQQEFQKINNNKNIELGFFTGDLVHFPEPEYWEAALEDLHKINCETHIAPGNHETYHPHLFEKYIGKYYYAFEKNNDLFIILNGNENGWNIEGEQLSFLKNTIAEKAGKAKHVFIFIHQIIWWQKNTEFGKCTPNSFMHMAKTLNFHQEILPFLKTIPKPVYLFAGDVGVFPDKPSLFHHKTNNVYLLASGMGNNKTDNYLIADVFENGEIKINVIGLNCEEGFECLGEIENY